MKTETAKFGLRNFIVDNYHPCVMAQSIMQDNNYIVKVYDSFGTMDTAEQMLKDLACYTEKCNTASNEFLTFIAVFDTPENMNELDFEHTLWKQMQLISNIDNHKWDPAVNSDPNDKDFSFSINGTAFYLVGMHPNSSRKARRTPFPCIAFNLHSQFEKLREMNVYGHLKKRIRKRDKRKNGSINPMLSDFGEISEARQYSGRAVDENWECPFISK